MPDKSQRRTCRFTRLTHTLVFLSKTSINLAFFSPKFNTATALVKCLPTGTLHVFCAIKETQKYKPKAVLHYAEILDL